MERYLSAPDVAKMLNVSNQAVYDFAKRGDLPIAAITESGMYLFRRADVDRIAPAVQERLKRRRHSLLTDPVTAS